MGLRLKIDDSIYLFFVTTTVQNFIKIFTDVRYCQVIIDNLNFYRRKYGFKLIAYVIMPEHLHLIVLTKANATLSSFMRDFNKYTSVQIKRMQLSDNNKKLISIFRKNATGYRNQEFKLWMDRFDRLVLNTPKILQQKVDYIHFNPVRANLVKDILEWKYSSARNYYLDDHSVIRIDNEVVLI